MKTTVPEYKLKLKAELKERLKSSVYHHVAAKCGYSSEYVRQWFLSAVVNDKIKEAAKNLLKELIEAEEKELAEVTELSK